MSNSQPVVKSCHSMTSSPMQIARKTQVIVNIDAHYIAFMRQNGRERTLRVPNEKRTPVAAVCEVCVRHLSMSGFWAYLNFAMPVTESSCTLLLLATFVLRGRIHREGRYLYASDMRDWSLYCTIGRPDQLRQQRWPARTTILHALACSPGSHNAHHTLW